MISHIRVRQAYERIVANVSPGTSIESLRSVEAVMAQRAYWRPERVRVVLLAESHLHTPEEELAAGVDLSQYGHPAAHAAYTRFVYCLGYGEDGIVSGTISKNRGTPQFWKLFHACVYGPDGPPSVAALQKGGTPELSTRVRNKLRVLEAMRRRGIWLVDASLVGVYIPGGEKLPFEEIRKCILASWHTYWRDELVAANPTHVLCIGIGVRRILQAELDECFEGRYSAIEQPNAMIEAARHQENLRNCFDICARHAPA